MLRRRHAIHALCKGLWPKSPAYPLLVANAAAGTEIVPEEADERPLLPAN